MAAATDKKDEAMSDDVDRDSEDEREEKSSGYRPAPARAPAAEATFFTIYKRGQGYWTRMCTAGAGLVIIGLTDNFLYRTALLDVQRGAKTAIVGAFTIAAAALVWWLMNKPDNAEFLIATDSEMKKVNWTSRQELIGSTKVVILVMLLIAALLFFTDVIFGYFFKWITVLKQGPFG